MGDGCGEGRDSYVGCGGGRDCNGGCGEGRGRNVQYIRLLWWRERLQ